MKVWEIKIVEEKQNPFREYVVHLRVFAKKENIIKYEKICEEYCQSKNLENATSPEDADTSYSYSINIKSGMPEDTVTWEDYQDLDCFDEDELMWDL